MSEKGVSQIPETKERSDLLFGLIQLLEQYPEYDKVIGQAHLLSPRFNLDTGLLELVYQWLKKTDQLNSYLTGENLKPLAGLSALCVSGSEGQLLNLLGADVVTMEPNFVPNIDQLRQNWPDSHRLIEVGFNHFWAHSLPQFDIITAQWLLDEGSRVLPNDNSYEASVFLQALLSKIKPGGLAFLSGGYVGDALNQIETDERRINDLYHDSFISTFVVSIEKPPALPRVIRDETREHILLLSESGIGFIDNVNDKQQGIDRHEQVFQEIARRTSVVHEKLLQGSCRVLDLGMGFGYLGHWLKEHFLSKIKTNLHLVGLDKLDYSDNGSEAERFYNLIIDANLTYDSAWNIAACEGPYDIIYARGLSPELSQIVYDRRARLLNSDGLAIIVSDLPVSVNSSVVLQVPKFNWAQHLLVTSAT